jgi:hypothetical protein
MLEKIKGVNNPLTVVALFAALAEVAGTIALATVEKDLQHTFVWFVMGFPILLVVLFFATLNFNPKVLYAPSDFRNEENFLSTVIGTHSVSMNLDQVTHQLEDAKKQILQQALEQISALTNTERAKLSEILNHQLQRIEARIESVTKEAEAVASSATAAAYPQSALQASILQLLTAEPAPKSLDDIAKRTGRGLDATYTALERLIERNLVVERETGSKDLHQRRFSLAKSGA